MPQTLAVVREIERHAVPGLKSTRYVRESIKGNPRTRPQRGILGILLRDDRSTMAVHTEK